ncbi:hypothetical protein [Vibrio penaeicida]|uniref:hypothetical protein n=1 Tax=Vibrio penaeicida TaxID=104609 RepID=UPI000CEA44F6|nr:hypothetical protein [Vibrio penaeicida]
MIITGSTRDHEIEKLNLTKALLKLSKGEFVHDDLEFRCNTLMYSLDTEDFSPNGLDVVPLWEGESSITGFYIHELKPIFITYNIDEIDSPKKIGNSISDLIDYLAVEYGEDEDELKLLLSQ